MAEPNDQETQDNSSIVCPLCLVIAIQSEGRSGSIQSYRCLARANGWETRPQKTDKWAEDFYRVLRTPKDETVTLTDGRTVMPGLGKGETKVFKFGQKDGERAYQRAMKEVVNGNIRAPRNWDRTFADEAGITMDELKEKFPTLYATRSTSREPADEEAIDELDAGFFDMDASSSVSEEATEEQQDEDYDEETDPVVEEYDEAETEGAFSVTAELGLDDETNVMDTPDRPNAVTQSRHEEGDQSVITINYPHPSRRMNIDSEIEMINIEIADGRWKRFYKVRHPATREFVFMPEGEQDDNSWMKLIVRNKPSIRQ